jgi:lipopolysaccharide export system permease protein
VDQAGYQGKIMESHQIKENRYMVEFHKKFSIPFACVVFTLLGVPLAVTASRSGKGVSVSLAIGIFLIYYLLLMGGGKLRGPGSGAPRTRHVERQCAPAGGGHSPVLENDP